MQKDQLYKPVNFEIIIMRPTARARKWVDDCTSTINTRSRIIDLEQYKKTVYNKKSS